MKQTSAALTRSQVVEPVSIVPPGCGGASELSFVGTGVDEASKASALGLISDSSACGCAFAGLEKEIVVKKMTGTRVISVIKRKGGKFNIACSRQSFFVAWVREGFISLKDITGEAAFRI
jgi:hypothetical protein